MISGKIAGVNVTSNDGAPGSGAQIRIRGGSSLNASNDPLIVIDGMAMDNEGVKGLSNKLAMINPQDIESFNVLKTLQPLLSTVHAAQTVLSSSLLKGTQRAKAFSFLFR